MPYHDKVIDHYENPRNVGTFGNTTEVKKNRQIGVGVVGAPECGDVMQLQIKVNDQGVIEDARFKTFGCGSAIACSSLATEWLKGRRLEDGLEIRNTEIVNELSLPPVKIHCSVLAEDAIRAAINDYRRKNGDEPPAGDESGKNGSANPGATATATAACPRTASVAEADAGRR